MKKSNLDWKITVSQGIKYLKTQQSADGSFISLSSLDSKNFGHSKKYQSVFPSSLILSCLNNLTANAEISEIKDKISNFLLSQKSDFWSFNYWVRDSLESKQLPYPDDLDDTFCALAALYQHNPKLIDGNALAKIITLLTTMETKVGGPYRTWLVGEDAPAVWKDVDLAVNSNIGFFLSLQEISLPKVNKLISQAIDTDKYTSPYYPSIYPVIYFISRFYKGKKSKKITEILLDKLNRERLENPLNTALTVLALLNFEVAPQKLESAVNCLLKEQKNGIWKPCAFCIDPAIERKTYFAGSSALTTVFCLEAIERCFHLLEKESINQKKSTKHSSKLASEIYLEVVKRARLRFSLLEKDLQEEATNFLDIIIKKDKDRQVVLLPYFFKNTLGVKGEVIASELLIKLGLANLYGWMAYTIYDDFLDLEGDPQKLSLANFCLRKLTIIFNNILPESGFDKFFQKVMDELDGANTWEVHNCRVKIVEGKLLMKDFLLPDYKNLTVLSQKSLGHMLGPLALLFSLGFNEKSPEVKETTKFFRHYLISRQLNDDAHDWQEDLKRGQVNSVGTWVLKKAQKMQQKEDDFESLLPKLQEIFWYQVVNTVADKILEHTKLAREILENSLLFADASALVNLLLPLESSGQKILQEHQKTVDFLSFYKQPA